MANRVLFHKQTTGPFGRGFDCWYLVTKEDGTFAVDHEWLHPAVSTDVDDDDVGTTSVSAGHFFAKVEDQELLSKLRRAITKIIDDESRLQIFALKLGQPSVPKFDPFATVIVWLRHCRDRDVDGLMTFYDTQATFDCACTGQKLCNGKDELKAYWEKRLADPAPTTFTLQDVWPSSDATVLDYISHNGQLVRSFFHFGDNGLIVHTKCGPIELAKAS